MPRTSLNEDLVKRALKEAFAEALQEHRALFHEIFAEVLEDFAPAKAIRQGQKTNMATRAEVFRILQGQS